jgi:ATP-dependent exoDNAse (exonuclease V) beta subunit
MLFAEATRNSLELGLGVHELFERVDWAGADIHHVVAGWGGNPDVSGHFSRAAATKEILGALAKPAGHPVLWREQRFEVVLGDEWVTGSFDRVVIEKDRATIIDFKTNEIREAGDLERVAADYAPQMKLYRRALAKLLGLAESKIGVKLIFTQAGKVIDV